MDTPGREQGQRQRSASLLALAGRWLRRGVMLALLAGATVSTAATQTFDVNALLDWAERAYPHLFPGPQPTLSAPPYQYRHYPQTGNHVGVDLGDGTVYLLGPVSQGQLQAVGPMAQFECQVMPANCAAGLPRLSVSSSVAVVRDSLGRHLAWGENRSTARTDGTPLPGTELRVLAQGAKQLVVSDYGGFEIKADGRLFAWGVGTWITGLDQVPFGAPIELKLPGPVAQMVQPGLLGFFAVALQTDGSVWQLPGTAVTVGGLLRYSPLSIPTPARVKALPSTSEGNATFMLLFDGSVWQADLAGGRPKQVVDVADVQQLSCGYRLCAALRKDGRVMTWAIGSDVSMPGAAAVVDELSNIHQVTAGGYWLAAIDKAGQLWSTSTLLTTSLLRPVAGFSGATDVACGLSTCIVIKADGTAWGWGDNGSGLLGRGVFNASGLTPVRITGVTVP